MFLYFIILLCLFLAVLGLCCCVGYSLVAVHAFLIAVASLVAENRLQGVWASTTVADALSSCGFRTPEHRLNSCGAWAYLLRGMWQSSQARD